MFMPNDTINIREDRVMTQEATEMPVSKVSFDQVVADLARLQQLVKQETSALERMQIKDVKAMHEEKLRLIRRLEIVKEMLKKHPQHFEGQRPEHKQAIRNMFSEMDGVLANNLREVGRARLVNEQVINAVVRALKAQDAEVSGYNNYGNIATAPLAAKRTLSNALTLNEKA